MRRLGWTLAALGIAAVTLAAREHAWTLGHWSQDLSPVLLLAGIALLSPALGRFALFGGEERPSGVAAADRLQLLGASITASGIALLGRSGLALVLAAVAAVAITYAVRPPGELR